MASVVDIAPPRPAPMPSFRKIRTASRGFRGAVHVLFVVFILLAVVSLGMLFFYQGDVIAIRPARRHDHHRPSAGRLPSLGNWRLGPEAGLWAGRHRPRDPVDLSVLVPAFAFPALRPGAGFHRPQRAPDPGHGRLSDRRRGGCPSSATWCSAPRAMRSTRRGPTWPPSRSWCWAPWSSSSRSSCRPATRSRKIARGSSDGHRRSAST